MASRQSLPGLVGNRVPDRASYLLMSPNDKVPGLTKVLAVPPARSYPRRDRHSQAQGPLNVSTQHGVLLFHPGYSPQLFSGVHNREVQKKRGYLGCVPPHLHTHTWPQAPPPSISCSNNGKPLPPSLRVATCFLDLSPRWFEAGGLISS